MARFFKIGEFGNINVDMISVWADFPDGRREKFGTTNDGVGVFAHLPEPVLELSIRGETTEVRGAERVKLLGMLGGMTIQ